MDEVCEQGKQLYLRVSAILQESPVPGPLELQSELEEAHSNLSAVRDTYNMAPIGFSEVLENASLLAKAVEQILDSYRRSGHLLHPGLKAAQNLLGKFRSLVETEEKQYFHSSEKAGLRRSDIDNETLAQLDFFKLRLSQTNESLAKQVKRAEEAEESIASLNSALDDANLRAADLRARIDEKLLETNAYLDAKQAEVNEVVGLIAAKSVVGSYEKSADIEKSSADWLRIVAILFMVLIMGVVGVTFYEITTGEFSWEKSALKLICSLLFSVPAAYLARESAKHRQQQYTHLQTALDLKAIGPYIATLPKEKQDDLKTDMAQKMFAPKTFDHVTKESYPINTQELVLALVDRLNDRKPSKTAESTQSGS
jgi:hypothetical protein